MAAAGKRIGVLMCGVTGAGKTSLIQLLCGKKKVPPSTASATKKTSIIEYTEAPVALVDTPGFLDNRKSEDRETLFNGMLKTIHDNRISVRRVFLLFSGKHNLQPRNVRSGPAICCYRLIGVYASLFAC